ncbi:MAG: right-handed parallel beta-helix repeat-containing protein, partial [Victivallaceae bacterium]|nr:right-handed parallel beta-helix repeat-containing protein [Victivallaceae bacterium]
SGPTLNVRDFGAAGDGKTIDTAAFAKALSALPDNGGTLKIPAGTYRILPDAKNDSMPFTCIRHHLLLQGKKNIRLLGDGDRSVLQFESPDHEGLRLVNLSDSSISDLKLTHLAKSRFRKSRSLLDLVAGKNLVVRNVTMENTPGRALRADAITSLRIEKCVIGNAGQNAIELLASRNVQVVGNRISNTRDHAIRIGAIGGIARLPQWIQIQENTIDGTREGCGIAISYGTEIGVGKNTIRNTYSAGVGIFYANAIFPVESVEITGNVMKNCAFGKLSYLQGVVSAFYTTQKKRRSKGEFTLRVTDNQIDGTSANGIWIDSCRGAGEIVLKGNRFHAVGKKEVSISPEQRKEIRNLILE